MGTISKGQQAPSMMRGGYHQQWALGAMNDGQWVSSATYNNASDHSICTFHIQA